MESINISTKKNKVLACFLSRDIFSLTYITVCILWFFPLLGSWIDPISKVCLIWGALIIFKDLLTQRLMFKSYYWALPILLMFFYCFSIVSNINTGLYMGAKHLLYSGLSLLILYAQDSGKSEKDLKKLLYYLNTIIIIVVFVAGIISIIMYAGSIGFEFYQGDTRLRQGFLENRLFGVYTSPNTGALFSIISIVAMCMNSFLKKKKMFKWSIMYIINGLVQGIYFSLTLSNGGMVTLSILVFLFFVIFYFAPSCQSKINAKALFITLILFVVSVAGVKLIMSGIRTGMSYVPSLVEQIALSESNETEEEKEDKIQFKRIESGDDLSNGRLTIWSGGIKMWKQYPLLGLADAKAFQGEEIVTKADISQLNKAEKEWIRKAGGNLHNSYVQILVNSGIIGMLLFITFAILLASNFIRFFYRGNRKSEQYNLLGLFFVILGAMAGNGMVETHLLFNRQDPYGAIFWFYIGLAFVFMEKFRKQKEYYDTGSGEFVDYAIACDTPLQVLNSIRFAKCNINNFKADIYIYHQFKDADKVSKGLEDIGIFNHVYNVLPYKKCSGFWSKLLTLSRLCFPTIYLKKYVQEKCSSRANYRYLVVSFQSPFTTNLHRCYADAKVVLLEDGTGTYFGDIMKDYSSKLFSRLDMLFANTSLQMHPVVGYLSNPSLLNTDVEYPIKSLVNLHDKKVEKIIEEVFSYEANNLYMKSKMIYLTQPLEEKKGFNKNNCKEIEQILFKNYREKLLVRVHPRQKQNEYVDFQVDTCANLWELECMKHLSDTHVLIGAFSTAQLMPKILADKEPYIIFIYKLLFEDTSENEWKNIQQLINTFKDMYREKNKIWIPQNIKELEQILEEL